MADFPNMPVEHVLELRRRQFRELSRPRGSLGAVDAEAQIRRQVKAAVSQGMAEMYSNIFREREQLIRQASEKRLTPEEWQRALDYQRGFGR